MHRVWNAVQRVERSVTCPWLNGGGGSAQLGIDDGLLRLMLEHGHSAITASDRPADIIEDMVLARDTLNSDDSMWPETHGYEEDDPEWIEMMDGSARRPVPSPPAVDTGDEAPA